MSNCAGTNLAGEITAKEESEILHFRCGELLNLHALSHKPTLHLTVW